MKYYVCPNGHLWEVTTLGHEWYLLEGDAGAYQMASTEPDFCPACATPMRETGGWYDPTDLKPSPVMPSLYVSR